MSHRGHHAMSKNSLSESCHKSGEHFLTKFRNKWNVSGDRRVLPHEKVLSSRSFTEASIADGHMVRKSSHGMEPTFYEEQYPMNAPVENLKRTLTLNLDFGRGAKRARSSAPLLSTPDLELMKLGSPEIEKIIIQNSMISLTTPTPGGAVLFSAATPTEEQEMYARPFVEILDKMHHNEPELGGRRVYEDLDRQPLERYPTPVVKDEPQTVPSASSSPPLSPIDMDSQERIKLERKRQRNRVAASKCRRRKLERISKLEDKVKLLKGENVDLAAMVAKLREHVSRLKEQVMEHVQGGCSIDYS